jgi:replication factor C subunit 1
MFTQKYKPVDLNNIIGNKLNINNIIKWLDEWSSKNKIKCLLISGNSGIGKTLSIELVLKQHNYNIIELNSDDEREKEYIKTNIKPILKFTKTLFGKKNVLVVNDLDCLSDYGFISSLTECIKETEIPIICTCNDRYNQSFKTLATYCADIKFQKPNTNDIYKFISNIIKNEKLAISETSARKLIENSNNDIRNTLNNLQISKNNSQLNFNKDNTQLSIFDITNTMLSQTNEFETKYNSFWLEPDLIPLMIHENYILNSLKNKNECDNLNNLYATSNNLSDLDLFETSVEVTNWELMPYVASTCIKICSNCHPKTRIQFPAFLGKTSTKNKNKRLIQNISKKYNESKISYITIKLDYINYLLVILFESLFNDKTKGKHTKFVVKCLDFGLEKEDIQENLFNLIIDCDEYKKYNYKFIDTKAKKAITTEFSRII